MQAKGKNDLLNILIYLKLEFLLASATAAAPQVKPVWALKRNQFGPISPWTLNFGSGRGERVENPSEKTGIGSAKSGQKDKTEIMLKMDRKKRQK